MHPGEVLYPHQNAMPNGRVRDLTPLERWWYRSTPLQKTLWIGGGTLAVAVPTILLVRWWRKPRPFTSVSEQCNDFALGNRQEIDDAIRPTVRASARRGAVNPFELTNDFIRRYAPQCRSFPESARNPGEAQMYVVSFAEVVRIMEEERLISPEQKGYFLEMVSVWGKSQGLPEDALPKKPPATASVEQQEAPG